MESIHHDNWVERNQEGQPESVSVSRGWGVSGVVPGGGGGGWGGGGIQTTILMMVGVKQYSWREAHSQTARARVFQSSVTSLRGRPTTRDIERYPF